MGRGERRIMEDAPLGGRGTDAIRRVQGNLEQSTKNQLTRCGRELWRTMRMYDGDGKPGDARERRGSERRDSAGAKAT